VEEGKSYLTVAVGCTGGRHRSVYLAEWLKKELSDVKNVTTRVRHRDLSRDPAKLSGEIQEPRPRTRA
jgi:UPF0042 nucleotide-binding protein